MNLNEICKTTKYAVKEAVKTVAITSIAVVAFAGSCHVLEKIGPKRSDEPQLFIRPYQDFRYMLAYSKSRPSEGIKVSYIDVEPMGSLDFVVDCSNAIKRNNRMCEYRLPTEEDKKEFENLLKEAKEKNKINEHYFLK